jgi:hypothetical protein
MASLFHRISAATAQAIKDVLHSWLAHVENGDFLYNSMANSYTF